MWDTPTVFLFQIAAISPQSSFLIWKDKVHSMHFFDMDRFVLTCSEYIKMWMIEGHPTSKCLNKRKRSLWILIDVWAGVFMCAWMCVSMWKRCNKYNLNYCKFVAEVICDCKSISRVYMLKCPEIPACGYVKESGSLSEWKKLKHALHKIYFFPFLSFLPCN